MRFGVVRSFVGILLLLILLPGCGDGDKDDGSNQKNTLRVTSTTPANAATNFSRTNALKIQFSTSINLATATPSTITLTRIGGIESISVSASDNQVTVTPAEKLQPLTQYTLTVSSAVRGQADEVSTGEISIVFTTTDKAWGTATQIDSGAGSANSPVIAIDNTGNALVAWSQRDDADGARRSIRANHFSATTGWGSAELIESNNTSSSYAQLLLAFDSNGNAFLVGSLWDGTYSHIWAKRYSTESGWSAATKIEAENTGVAQDPQLAIDKNGNALVVWHKYDGERTDIWANRYTVGKGWATAVTIESDNSASARYPQVAYDSASNAIAVWGQYNSTNSTFGINHYTVGTGWGVATLVDMIGPGPTYSRQIAFDSDDNLMMVWRHHDGKQFNLLANRYVAGGGWGIEELLESSDLGNAHSPQLVVDPMGNALVVWRQPAYLLPLSYSGPERVWVNRYTVGRGWGKAEIISSDGTSGSDAPQIAIDTSGNALATWADWDGKRLNIWSSRYTIGAGWGTAELIEFENSGSATKHKTAFDSKGNALTVWEQYDGSNHHIWANRYSD